jgi:CDP-glycerol glycerophosphotransferase (TagB/SpsB family)
MKQLLASFIEFTFNVFDKCLPHKKYIIFASRGGKDYADNSRSLYEEFLEKGDSNVFYFTKKKSVLALIPQNGIYAYSLKGFFILIRAKVLVFTHGTDDFSPYVPQKHKNRIFINLFHAIAVKKVGLQGSEKAKIESEKWDYFLVSSPFEAEFIKEQYLLKDEQILIVGQPRNDVLCEKKVVPSKKVNKSILYAPTFRTHSDTIIFPFSDLDLTSLDQFLEEHNIEIIIRLHINDENRYRINEDFKNLKQIVFSGSKVTPTVNDILFKFDAVISDYSSILIDYLLLDKPVAYTPYDFEEYEQKRGFSFDYHEHRFGPIINTQEDLKAFLLTKEDDFSEKRNKMKNKFHTYQDGESAKRMYNYIKNL